ncbi:MAG: hypothetical protein AUG49_22490 [Catenulispora sp. 13_1_20CM_3_70_7]|nr:MAG: hypothetical protein AUG49_22490 [Catenulispora sp. 13_1_20CM_3_70_7]
MRFVRAARSPDVAAVGLLIALPLALFWRTLSGGLVVAGYDLILYSYPYRVAVARAVQEGRVPLWNPDLFAGVPMLANIQTAVLYPFNLLFVWPGGPQLLSWSIIVHLALAGLFFYGFARKALELASAPSALGAVAFSASGFAIAQSEHLNQANALPWVPALLLAFDQAYRTRRAGWGAALGLILALQIFAGHPQDVYYGFLLLSVWAIVLLIRKRADGMRAMLTSLGMPMVGLIAGLLVAAVQLVPTVELSRLSYRSGGLPWKDAIAFSMRGRGMLGNLLPDYVTEINGEWAGYIGIIATALALGPLTPAFWLGYHALPGLALFRVPARAQLISTFAGSALAGIGAAEAQRQLRDGRLRIAALPVGVVGVFFIVETVAYGFQQRGWSGSILKAFPQPIPGRQLLIWVGLGGFMALALLVAFRRPGWLTPMLAVLVSIETLLAAQPLNPPHALPARIYQSSAALDAALPTDQSPYRSLSLAGLSDQQLNGGLSDPRFRAYSGRRAIDQPDFALQDGRATLDGYDGGILPLATYVQFRPLLLPRGTFNQPDFPFIVLSGQPANAALLGLLGVKDVLVQPTTVAQAPSEFRPVGQVGNVVILENSLVQPRAFVVHDVHPARGTKADLATLASSGFDPASTAIASAGCTGASRTGNDLVELRRNDPEALDVTVATEGGGLLVISTVDYPGWTARVDGRGTSMVKVDDLLQGVCLPPGVHSIQLRFAPSGWPAAVAASIVGLLLVLYLGLAGTLRRRLFFELPHHRR